MSKKTYAIAAAIATAIIPLFALTASAQTPTTNPGHGLGRGHGGTHFSPMRGRGPGVFGTVTAVSGTTLTVSSAGHGKNATATVYTVDASHATVKKNGATAAVTDVAVGDKVMIKGTITGTNVVATAVNDGVGSGMMPGRTPGIFGTVTAISGTTLTVSVKGFGPNATTTVYTVDASSAKVDKSGTASTLADIVVGDAIKIDGTITGTNMVATAIHDGVNRMGQRIADDEGGTKQAPAITGNGQPVIMGNVTAVSGNTLTITNNGNVSYTVDATSATVTKSGATSTISDVTVGDRVIVQGTVNGTSITATSVIDQGAPHVRPTSNVNGGGEQNGGDNQQGHSNRGFFGRIHDFFAHLFGF